MKIHILYNFVEGPYGGGNQFLKALRGQLILAGKYADNIDDADGILLNAFPTDNLEFFLKAIELKKIKNIPLFYRLDGLFYKNRLDPSQMYIDEICRYFANTFCDGIVYQSDWVKEIQQDFGISKQIPSTTILNAPDPEIFFKRDVHLKSNKIKLVSTSWSPNQRKGFDTYKWLDINLNYNKYEFTFVGNVPVLFENIKVIPPLTSVELSSELSRHDIFISAAFDEPCSNSLIEALHVGLPAIGHDSGGTPQIINKAGILFSSNDQLLKAIETISLNLDYFRSRIQMPTISEVSLSYYNFFESCKLVKRPRSNEFLHFKKLLRTVPSNETEKRNLPSNLKSIIQRLKRIAFPE